MKKFFLIVALVLAIAMVVPVASPVNVIAQAEMDIPTVWYQTTLSGNMSLSGWDETPVGTGPAGGSTILYKKVGDFVLWAGSRLMSFKLDDSDPEDPVWRWDSQVDSWSSLGGTVKLVSKRELRFTTNDLDWTDEDDEYVGLLRLELRVQSDRYVLEGSCLRLASHDVGKFWGLKGTEAASIACPQEDVRISEEWRQTIIEVTKDRYDTDYTYLRTESSQKPILYRRVGDAILVADPDGIVKCYRFDPVLNIWTWNGHVDVVYSSGAPYKLQQFDKLRFTEDDLDWTEADDDYAKLRLELKRETTRYRLTDGCWERNWLYTERQWAPRGDTAETQDWYQTTLSGNRVRYSWDWTYGDTASSEYDLVYQQVGDFLFTTRGRYVEVGRFSPTLKSRSWRGCINGISSTTGKPMKMAQKEMLRFTESGGVVTLTLERQFDYYSLNLIENSPNMYCWTETPSHYIFLQSGPEGTPVE